MSSADRGWSSPNAPLASPGDYFEASFTAQAYVPYRIWLRVRAKNNSKWNESVWVQFNDSLNSSGGAAYRIGTTSSVLMNLEECSGCGVSSWGWTGGSYWTSVNQQVQFPTAGTKTIRIQTREDGADIDQIVLSPSRYLSTRPGATRNDTTILPRSGGASSGSTTNTARALPGVIQAQDFDNGANGTAYYDRTSGNNGGQYRSGDVDIERTSDSSGTYNVGWTDAGEWLNYTVDVASAGSYTIEMRVASPNGSQTRVRFGGTDVTGAMSIPATGGWQSWRTIQRTVTLPAGTQVMRVVFDASGANFNWIRVIENSSSGGSGSDAFSGTAWAVPGTIQAENFDLGGQGVGHYDNTPGNTGGQYRSTDVDIERTSDSSGSYNVGWVGAGEWLNYTVNVATTGNYTLTARVASNGSGGTFYVEFGGVNKTGTMTVPNTGGWQSYRDVNVTVSLSAGTQVMRIRMTGNGSTGAVGNFNYIRLASGSTNNTPPTVSLTAPANGATFSAPATVSVNASASDSNGSIARVDFYAGSTLIGSDTTSPYAITWSSVPAGTYTLTARATDNGGAATTSAPVSITVNGTTTGAPTVSVTSPANGGTFSAPRIMSVTASASDQGGSITRVDFYVGTTLIASDTTSPYTASWNVLTAGTYTLTARATDNSGITTTSAAVTVTANPSRAVFNPPSDHSTAVTSYLLEIYAAGATPGTTTPARSQNVGKPSVINGVITVDITATLQPLAAGSYFATMSAVRSTGSTRSAASNTFGR